jgi:hypothetical protein
LNLFCGIKVLSMEKIWASKPEAQCKAFMEALAGIVRGLPRLQSLSFSFRSPTMGMGTDDDPVLDGRRKVRPAGSQPTPNRLSTDSQPTPNGRRQAIASHDSVAAAIDLEEGGTEEFGLGPLLRAVADSDSLASISLASCELGPRGGKLTAAATAPFHTAVFGPYGDSPYKRARGEGD